MCSSSALQLALQGALADSASLAARLSPHANSSASAEEREGANASVAAVAVESALAASSPLLLQSCCRCTYEAQVRGCDGDGGAGRPVQHYHDLGMFSKAPSQTRIRHSTC